MMSKTWKTIFIVLLVIGSLVFMVNAGKPPTPMPTQSVIGDLQAQIAQLTADKVALQAQVDQLTAELGTCNSGLDICDGSLDYCNTEMELFRSDYFACSDQYEQCKSDRDTYYECCS